MAASAVAVVIGNKNFEGLVDYFSAGCYKYQT
jgi:hypothetical protein